VLWFTGISGAGKTTIANRVEQKLLEFGRHTFLLDGDDVRYGLNRDLGFTAVDRVENVRRVAEVAKLMADAGLIVLAALISPFRVDRQLARALLADGEFTEVHIDTPLEVAERRDPKGLYRNARAGRIKNFTGIDSPYEPPETPELHVCTVTTSVDEAADFIVDYLRRTHRIE
jgi:bifunctional enzyme CysN/CysC